VPARKPPHQHRHRFEAVIEPIVWGRSTYTVIRLPDAVWHDWRDAGAKRVTGTITPFGDEPVTVDLAPSSAPHIDGRFLWAGKSLLRTLRAEPGEVVTLDLWPADHTQVELPDDVEAALIQAGALAAWDELTAGRKRGLLYTVDSAVSPATRHRRIERLVAQLTGR
jgi:hypothetical protein